MKTTTQPQVVYLLYGLERGESRPYMESLLLSCGQTLNDVERVKAHASNDGWHSFRVATHIEGEAPDFTNVLA